MLSHFISFSLGLVGALSGREGASRPLYDLTSGPVTGLDAGLKIGVDHVLLLHELTQEATDEGIAGTIGVHKELLGELLDLVASHDTHVSDDSSVGSLGENNGAGPCSTDLRASSDSEGNLWSCGIDLSECVVVSMQGLAREGFEYA